MLTGDRSRLSFMREADTVTSDKIFTMTESRRRVSAAGRCAWPMAPARHRISRSWRRIGVGLMRYILKDITIAQKKLRAAVFFFTQQSGTFFLQSQAFLLQEPVESFPQQPVPGDQLPGFFRNRGAAAFFPAGSRYDEGPGRHRVEVIDDLPGFLVGHIHFLCRFVDGTGLCDMLHQFHGT